MLDSINHMTLIILKNYIFGVKDFPLFGATLLWMSLCYVIKSVNHLWFINFIAWRYITPTQDVM